MKIAGSGHLDFENSGGPYKVSACAGLFVRQFFLYH